MKKEVNLIEFRKLPGLSNVNKRIVQKTEKLQNKPEKEVQNISLIHEKWGVAC